MKRHNQLVMVGLVSSSVFFVTIANRSQAADLKQRHKNGKIYIEKS